MVIIVKKRILILVLLSFMITGVVSAASLWGSYKGNAVVRVKVDGQVNKPLGVPAIMYNGQLMVPSRLLTKIGVPFSFDQKKLTLDVKTQKPATAPAAVTELQNHAMIADMYNRLENVGNMITDMSSGLSLVYDAYELGKGSERLEQLKQNYSQLIDIFNGNVTDIKDMDGAGLDVGATKSILSSYLDAFDNYDKAFDSISNFITSGRDQDFDDYLDYSSKGFDAAFEGKNQSFDNYSNHMSAIINN